LPRGPLNGLVYTMRWSQTRCGNAPGHCGCALLSTGARNHLQVGWRGWYDGGTETFV